MKNKAIIIAGNVDAERIKVVIAEAGLTESEVIIVDDTERLKHLTEFRNPEVQERLAIERIEPVYIPKCEYDNFEKKLSQQGWKNRPRHKR